MMILFRKIFLGDLNIEFHMLETFSENFPGIIVSNIVEYSALFSYRICKKVSEDVPND